MLKLSNTSFQENYLHKKIVNITSQVMLKKKKLKKLNEILLY